MGAGEFWHAPGMKSCMSLLFVLSIFVLVMGGGGLIWYLSDTAEFSSTTAKPPVAKPVVPLNRSQGKPPVAIPVTPQPR